MIRTALLVLAVAALALETSAQAPGSSLARTPDGKPDLQGNWSTMWITPLERPPEASELVVPASEQAVANVFVVAPRSALRGSRRIQLRVGAGAQAQLVPYTLIGPQGDATP